MVSSSELYLFFLPGLTQTYVDNTCVVKFAVDSCSE